MARTHARIHTRVWTDAHFRDLTADAQRVYFVLLSQADISHCGVITYRPKRWALLAADTTTEAVEKAISELEDRRYVIVDRETDELWVRSFIKHDGIITSPNMLKAMDSAFDGVLSEPIREGFIALLNDLDGKGLLKGSTQNAGKGKGLGVGGAKPLPHEGCPECDGSGFVPSDDNTVKKCLYLALGDPA